MDIITIDFESKEIEPRPNYPPEPVGVSIKWPGLKSRYYAWGHLTENNCTVEDAIRALKKAWASGLPLLFHNSKFDLSVACEKLGMKMPLWHRIHDTMFLIFLDNPYSQTLALKPSAEVYLGMAPTEQHAVRDWLMANARSLGIRSVTANTFGKYIWMAPGSLVAKYAAGDTDRTEKLFKLLYKRVVLEKGMEYAYNTERELMPILLENEMEGMRVAHSQLSRDTSMFNDVLLRLDEHIAKRLKTPGMNINSDPQLAEALERCGVVTDFVLTKTGRPSTSKDNLTIDRFHDERIFRLLAYRGKLSTALSTFMRPWLAVADQTGGWIHTDWRQIKREGAGAITGRLSSSPNFQNIPKPWGDKDNEYVHPAFVKWLPELPSLRKYILPDMGQLFGHRDFSQQELRILAHFENGPLQEAFKRDSRLDVHDMVKSLLEDFGVYYDRTAVKGTNFGILYGMGITGIAKRLHIDKAAAGKLIRTWNRAMPGVSQLTADLKAEVSDGGVICTWGGRQYGMPPPMFVDGESRSREYVLLNYLIQGSGADCTKRALIEFHKKKKESRILCNVHDEINISATKDAMPGELKILEKCMVSLEFDVPMLSDSKIGKSWGTLAKVK